MPRLEPIGRTANPNVPDPDAEPLIVPIVGYKAARDKKGAVIRDEDGHPIGEEVELEVRFLPMSLAGMSVRSMGVISTLQSLQRGKPQDERDERAAVIGTEILTFVDKVIFDDDRRAFIDFVGSPEIEVTFETLAELYKALTEFYAEVPTTQRSVSHNGRVTTSTTSRAAASSKASTTNRSQRRARSTSSTR